MTHDLVIRNARVFRAGKKARSDVAIDAGRIVSVGAAGTDIDATGAGEEVDADGLLLLPGLIDDHVHFREPGKEEKEDFESGSRAAAHGGVTTAFEIQNNAPLVLSREVLDAKLALARGKSRINIGLYANANASSMANLADMADVAMGFKVFLAPSHGDKGVDADGTLRVIFEQAARTDSIVVVHAEDRAAIADGLRRHGASGPAAWSKARSAAAEVKACERAVRIAPSQRRAAPPRAGPSF